MGRRKEREEIMTILYMLEVGGEYDKENYSNFANEKVIDLIENVEEIDEIISRNLTNWTIDRLNYVDKAIIRYATYEMMNTILPSEIIINEAIELTKEFSDIDGAQKAFNNKLLDCIKNDIRK